jgi:hypothetical protein
MVTSRQISEERDTEKLSALAEAKKYNNNNNNNNK